MYLQYPYSVLREHIQIIYIVLHNLLKIGFILVFDKKSFFCLSVRLKSVLRGHPFFSSPPQGPMNSDFEGFSYQILFITFLSHLNSRERVSISLF